jgi:autotransporter-associated beta strand protein
MSNWVGGNGDWANPAKWNAGIPDAPDAIANFPSVPQFGYLIDLEGNSFTVGSLIMQSNVLGYDVFLGSAGSTIVMERSAGSALISVGAPGVNPNIMHSSIDLWLASSTTLDSTGTALNLVMDCRIIGSGILTKTGGGIVEISNPANSWTGGLSIANGTIRTSAAGVLSSGFVIIGAAGFLDLADHNQSIRSLSGVGTVNLGGATLTVLQQDVSLTNIFTGSALADALTVNMSSIASSFSLAGCSFVSWNSLADRVSILGNSLANTITGSGVPDYIDGGRSDDMLFGGAGGDSLVGGTGSDTLYGGVNADTLLMDDYGNPAASDGFDTGYGEAGDDLLWGYGGNDNLYGGANNDALVGNDYASAVAGNDGLYGGSGDDTMFVGLGGNAYMDGGTGADIFYGGLLADVLRGGTGNDYLYGNAGSDAFLFYSFDFAAADSDIVYFVDAGDRLKFSAALNGALTFTNTVLQYDANPAHTVASVYITVALGGGLTAAVAVYGATVAQLMPMVEFTL